MNSTIKYSSLILGLIIITVCSYFMVANAFWLPGDEAIVMKATGWGHPFIPPREPLSIGRFFPLSYSFYNILLLFPHGSQIDVRSIYWLHVFALVVFSVFMAKICLHIMKDNNTIKYPITLFVVLFSVFRIYTEFITCYTAVWMVLFLLPVFIWYLIRFTENNKLYNFIIALIIINYLIYCYETMFTIPLTIGACALVFNYKRLNKIEKTFYSLLILSALLFLSLYVVLVIPQTIVAYDGAHGKDITIIGNAIRIFIAQKTLWIAAVLLIYRIVDCVRYGLKVNIFDYLLLSCFTYFCGAATLKLNFCYYYNISALLSIPAIIYYTLKIVKPLTTFALFFTLCVFYGSKISTIIHTTQESRVAYKHKMKLLCKYIEKGYYANWFLPDNSNNNYDPTRFWRREYTSFAIGWLMNDEKFFVSEENYYPSRALWFVFGEDDISFQTITGKKEMVYSGDDGTKCYIIE